MHKNLGESHPEMLTDVLGSLFLQLLRQGLHQKRSEHHVQTGSLESDRNRKEQVRFLLVLKLIKSLPYVYRVVILTKKENNGK